MSGCPPTLQLERLLGEDLAAAELAAVERHLESCARCQGWLEAHVRGQDPDVVRRCYGMGRPRATRPDEGESAWWADAPPPRPETPPVHSNGVHPPVSRPDGPAAGLDSWAGPPGYILAGELGTGAAGVVYRARHEALNRYVALKVMRAVAPAAPDAVRRFRTEAAAAARLQHPNIVQVYEVGEHGGVPFLALELVEGGSLARDLPGAPRPLRPAAALVEVLARAVQHAHDRGVVHRDLKPANILLAPDGSPKITDFGLAKLLDGGGGATHSGALLGTPSYMAPEQATGRAGAVGPAADVHALGAILYELLTGRPPFRGESAFGTALQVAHREPVPPARLRPAVPRDLETICLKCLEKDPRRRYPTAAALADDLKRFLAGESVRARPVGIAGRWVRWARRRPARAALPAAALLAAGLVAWAEAGWRNASDRARAAAEARREADRDRYFHRVALAHREWHANQVARADELLDGCPDGLRGWEWHYLKRLCHAERLALRGHADPAGCLAVSGDGRRLASCNSERGEFVVWDVPGGRAVFARRHGERVAAAAFSPDGARLSTAGSDGTVRTWDASTGAELSRRDSGGPLTDAAFSPDGRRLAACGDGRATVRIWDVDAGRVVAPLHGHRRPVLCLAFSPDGRHLATGGGDPGGGELYLWDAATGREEAPGLSPGKAVQCLAFSPDGRYLASGSRVTDNRLGDRAELRVWDVASGRPAHSFAGHTLGVTGLAFSPDGRRLASAGGDRTVRLWEVDSGAELFAVKEPCEAGGVVFGPGGAWVATAGRDGVVRVWDAERNPQGPVAARVGPGGVMTALAFFPGGRRLASAGLDGAVRVWDAASGGQLHEFATHAGHAHAVAVSPDGRTVASAGRDRLVWLRDVEAGGEPRTLRGHTDFVFGVAYSPDGRTVASAGRDGAVRVWDAPAGREVRALRGHAGFVYAVTFSPDGRRLASGGHDGTARVWDASSGEQLTAVTAAYAVTAVAFSPDGRRLATACGSDDPAVRVWEVADGRELLTCQGHSLKVAAVAFSPDGRRIVSGSDDWTVRVWDAETGREALVLECSAGVAAVAFSPDGRRLAAADWQTWVRVWEAAPRPGE